MSQVQEMFNSKKGTCFGILIWGYYNDAEGAYTGEFEL